MRSRCGGHQQAQWRPLHAFSLKLKTDVHKVQRDVCSQGVGNIVCSSFTLHPHLVSENAAVKPLHVPLSGCCTHGHPGPVTLVQESSCTLRSCARDA